MNHWKRHPLVTGTIILTLTGLFSRLIGFFYRIYLARLFGEEGMGVYQLLSPVLSLSFSLTAAGYQTAISKLVAESGAKQKKPSCRPLFAGLSVSIPLSLCCLFVIFHFSDWIALHLLLEPRTAPMLRILAFSIPMGAVHSCINGYFYGIKKAGVPAATQLLEQCCRVGSVYLTASLALRQNAALTINVAVFGLTVGELCSMLLSLLSIYLVLYRKRKTPWEEKDNLAGIYRPLLGMALPLTANRIVLNLLQSVESVSIPARLKAYGYDSNTALSVYGVLTGMAMPLIFFPNALTSSVSVLLLPIISEAYAQGDRRTVWQATLRTIRYCLLLGILCMSGFLLSGRFLGTRLFKSQLAGHFIITLSFLCPFLYLDTTLSSILQGLGMAGRIFLINACCLLLRLTFVFFAVPVFGITGYLWGMLASQITLSVLYLLCLYLSRKKL